METIKWFDRKFNFEFGTSQYEHIYQRLKQSPLVLKEITSGIAENILVQKPDGKWSVNEHIGHLCLLEPLWCIRFKDIREMKAILTPADLDNRATSEAGFNKSSITELSERFMEERSATLLLLNSINMQDSSRTSMHPRLQQPVRLIDLAYFVAEHDEHHISYIANIIRLNNTK